MEKEDQELHVMNSQCCNEITLIDWQDTEVQYIKQGKTSSGKVPQSVFFQEKAKWQELVFSKDHVDHKHCSLATRPRCRQFSSYIAIHNARLAYIAPCDV